METHADHSSSACCEGKAPVFGDWQEWVLIGLGLLLFLGGILGDFLGWFQTVGPWVRIAWYTAAYLPVGVPVVWSAVRLIRTRDIFNEFSLMSLATFGAFGIGQYPEGVAVMLFYSIGEQLQDGAVNRAKRTIRALLDLRPQQATVIRGHGMETIPPQNVGIGESIFVKPGERVPLDSVLESGYASFNGVALTGESIPRQILKGEPVLAGMVAIDASVRLTVTQSYQDSTFSRILALAQDAMGRKAKPEQFIHQFAKVYTPIVVGLAVALVAAPYFFVTPYLWREWVGRALVFLVISCPCALVVSVPLSYFAGIGAASRQGLLFKGGHFLDVMARIRVFVADKTGTLTQGIFSVQRVAVISGTRDDFLKAVLAVESHSTHPIAKAVAAYARGQVFEVSAVSVSEWPGLGLSGQVDGQTVLVGNLKLMAKFDVQGVLETVDSGGTVVYVAKDGQYLGSLIVSDEVRPDAAEMVRQLTAEGVERVVMLSGDDPKITAAVARSLGIDQAYGGLLPEEKVQRLQALQKECGGCVAFMGDGINDAPVLALSDVGIAMGGLGSDAAIETADVVIQTDQLFKVGSAIRLAKLTRRIVWQNIALALGLKVVILGLGAMGLAALWAAVFADVGVTMLAVLNTMRIQKFRAL